MEEAEPDQLLDVSTKLGDRRVREQAERTELVVRARDDLLARLPAQDARHVRRAEPLADADDAREDLPREDDGLGCGLELAQAHVAGGAVVLRIPVAEVRAEVPMPAADARGVALHQPQQTSREPSVSSPFCSSMWRHFMKSALE